MDTIEAMSNLADAMEAAKPKLPKTIRNKTSPMVEFPKGCVLCGRNTSTYLLAPLLSQHYLDDLVPILSPDTGKPNPNAFIYKKYLCSTCLMNMVGKQRLRCCDQCNHYILADSPGIHDCLKYSKTNTLVPAVYCPRCASVGGYHKDDGECKIVNPNGLPWEQRGVVPDSTQFGNLNDSYWTVWGFRPQQHDPVKAAADYYILLPIRDATYAPGIKELRSFEDDARQLLKDLVKVYDPVFCRYVDMAIGGELRYSKRASRVLSSNRARAWNTWKYIREAVGPDALLDAADLFKTIRQMQIGGARWATISKTLHARITGKITPELWLDRVFSLQHNCGTVLSKVPWASDPEMITRAIGPAHQEDPPKFDELYIFASTQVRELWKEYTEYVRKLSRQYGLSLPSQGWTTSNEKPDTVLQARVRNMSMQAYKDAYCFPKKQTVIPKVITVKPFQATNTTTYTTFGSTVL